MITTGGTGANAVVAAVAAQDFQLLLMDPTSLRGHPALINYARMPGYGGLTGNVVLFGLDGYDLMVSTSEGSTTTETALTSALKSLTVAARHLRRDLSDIMGGVDPTGALNPTNLARDGFASAMHTLTSLIASLASGFSVQVGTTGVDFDHDLFLAAKGALIVAQVPGPYLCVMWPQHFADWTTDLESRSGITQWNPANAAMQILKGPGYKGSYDGIDIFVSDKCPASSSDRISMMIGRGAVAYGEQTVNYPQSAIILFEAGPVACEEVRNGNGAATSIITHYYVGVTEVQDAAGVGMLATG